MTRFARAGKRKFVEASSWSDLSKDVTSLQSQTNKPDSPTKDSKFKMLSKKTRTQDCPIDPKRQKQIEARRLRRKKSICCFVCRQYGHQAAECPNKDDMKIGTCFKCGSSDHTTRKCKSVNKQDKLSGDFPFAKCFICQEMGHLAKSCPENPRGLYPQGGGCKICGSVEHLKRDCSQVQKSKKAKEKTVDMVESTKDGNNKHMSGDSQGQSPTFNNNIPNKKKKKKGQKIVKF